MHILSCWVILSGIITVTSSLSSLGLHLGFLSYDVTTGPCCDVTKSGHHGERCDGTCIVVLDVTLQDTHGLELARRQELTTATSTQATDEDVVRYLDSRDVTRPMWFAVPGQMHEVRLHIKVYRTPLTNRRVGTNRQDQIDKSSHQLVDELTRDLDIGDLSNHFYSLVIRGRRQINATLHLAVMFSCNDDVTDCMSDCSQRPWMPHCARLRQVKDSIKHNYVDRPLARCPHTTKPPPPVTPTSSTTQPPHTRTTSTTTTTSPTTTTTNSTPTTILHTTTSTFQSSRTTPATASKYPETPSSSLPPPSTQHTTTTSSTTHQSDINFSSTETITRMEPTPSTPTPTTLPANTLTTDTLPQTTTTTITPTQSISIPITPTTTTTSLVLEPSITPTTSIGNSLQPTVYSTTPEIPHSTSGVISISTTSTPTSCACSNSLSSKATQSTSSDYSSSAGVIETTTTAQSAATTAIATTIPHIESSSTISPSSAHITDQTQTPQPPPPTTTTPSPSTPPTLPTTTTSSATQSPPTPYTSENTFTKDTSSHEESTSTPKQNTKIPKTSNPTTQRSWTSQTQPTPVSTTTRSPFLPVESSDDENDDPMAYWAIIVGCVLGGLATLGVVGYLLYRSRQTSLRQRQELYTVTPQMISTIEENGMAGRSDVPMTTALL